MAVEDLSMHEQKQTYRHLVHYSSTVISNEELRSVKNPFEERFLICALAK